ncbi:hypothetical protein [Streptomyces sp. NPDC059788]|uniref:hypothetical protein n=1 Tax=Streptomyces sp. NPDC059788 TaxID=3346948 RepID=UPI003648A69A
MPTTAANVDGLSLGVIGAGLPAEFVPAPTRTVFWCYLGVRAAAGFAWPTAPETAGPRTHRRPRVRRPARPRGAGRACSFAAGGVHVAGASGVNGFFSSSAPAFARDDLGISNLAVVGAGVGALFVGALSVQVFMPSRLLRRSIRTGLPGNRDDPHRDGTVDPLGASRHRRHRLRPGSCRDRDASRPRRHGRAERTRQPHRVPRATYFLFVCSGLVGSVLLLGALDQIAGTRISNITLTVLAIAIAIAISHRARGPGPGAWHRTSNPHTNGGFP